MLKRKVLERINLQKHKKTSTDATHTVKTNRFLITVNVLGSAGPIRFVVNEDDLVARVIDTALKSYAREGRLPVLGSDVKDFLLHCANAGSDGSRGGRNFVLSKKQKQVQNNNIAERKSEITAPKGTVSSWKAWLNKSFTFKISSH
ncbi:hypothetical protein DVH24_030890 [Malus domestica]|uniref:DUF7054 domain-containing protein n=1 Tax=Malus domestica TaxID=3750 RepID=A0A498HGW4_MALDO|nr:hypothetical protein DVH24_030890 [Malus domestica]